MRRSGAGNDGEVEVSSEEIEPRSMPSARQTWPATGVGVVSSKLAPIVSASMRRRFTPSARAAARTSSARPGTRTATVSKKSSCTTSSPPSRTPAAKSFATSCTCVAIAVSPSGPW